MNKFLLIIAIFFAYTLPVFAAEVYIVAPTTVTNSKTFSVLLNLDTGGTLINSLDMTVSYPKDLITFKGYKEENSIKKSWYLPPTDISGAIHFIGIIPGGVDGVYDPDKKGLQPLPIIELLFSAKANGNGEFVITDSNILQNDGLGTSLSHVVNSATIKILLDKDFIEEEKKLEKDINLPEPFTIEYIVAGFFSKTPSMISFSTTDIESGVEKYQLRVRNDLWKDVVSPLPTPKALFRRDVVIRAVDFDGNMRESQIEIPGLLSGIQLFIIVLILVACYFTFFVFKRKK
jgi:hypothetical protein